MHTPKILLSRRVSIVEVWYLATHRFSNWSRVTNSAKSTAAMIAFAATFHRPERVKHTPSSSTRVESMLPAGYMAAA